PPLILKHIVDHYVAALLSVIPLISLLGTLLSWVLLCAEIMFAAAKDQTMPEFLRREKAKQVQANALWLTNICVQVF
ncbi:amino acid permease, partial [Pseudomonas aeruginosa]